jgi:hypothetical protein
MTDHALTSDPPVHRPTAPDFTQIANRSKVIAVLENQAGAVRTELARVDGKAGLLLSWAGGAFAIVAAATVTGTTRLPAPATAGLWTASALLAAAVALLLLAVRPRLPRPGKGTGFVAAAGARDGDDLVRRFAVDLAERSRQAADDVLMLSRIAHAKYRAIRRAVDLLLTALAVLAVTLPLGALA